MVGFDVETDLGEQKGGERDAQGAVQDGYASGYLELGTAIGFGVGTGQQVEPPLDNSQITDKGFVVQGSFGVGWRMSRNLALGVAVPVQLGYLIKSGGGAVVNDGGSSYVELNAAALLTVRLKVEL
jgi:hypothetical protein